MSQQHPRKDKPVGNTKYSVVGGIKNIKCSHTKAAHDPDYLAGVCGTCAIPICTHCGYLFNFPAQRPMCGNCYLAYYSGPASYRAEDYQDSMKQRCASCGNEMQNDWEQYQQRGNYCKECMIRVSSEAKVHGAENALLADTMASSAAKNNTHDHTNKGQ